MRKRLLRLRRIDLVSLVDRGDNPGAEVLIYKRADDEARPGEEDEVKLTDAIAKALAVEAGDSPAEREEKELIVKQMRAGVLSPRGYAAQLALDAHATSIAERDTCSWEQGFVKALDEHPDLTRLLD